MKIRPRHICHHSTLALHSSKAEPRFPMMRSAFSHRQKGMTTTVIVLLLLAIVTLISIAATASGMFEQRTASNEHRHKLAQTMADAALNQAVEYMKSQVDVLTSTGTGGWLASTGGRWQPCTTAVTSGVYDPCTVANETANADRDQMYRYISGGSTSLPINAMLPAAAQIDSMVLDVDAATGAPSEEAAGTAQVSAVLCRFDIDDPADPQCNLDPESPGMLAITLISRVNVPGESTVAFAKETVGTFKNIGGAINVPVVAAGTVQGLGNAELVASPNAGGPGVPVSIWSPCPIDIEEGAAVTADPECAAGASGGTGSVITCHLGDFLGTVPENQLFTTCATTNSCGCPSDAGMSGHVHGSTALEGIDILDIDGNAGALPDIQYFPREPYDNPTNAFDDSVFELVFATDVVPEGQVDVAQTCTGGDCAKAALEDLQPIKIATAAACSTLGPSSSGMYWAMAGCNIPNNTTIGSPTAPVILVVEDALDVQGNSVIFGMVFVRSSTNSAVFGGNGNIKVFGMVIVEGTVNTSGGIQYIYSDQIREAINNSPAFQRFGRVPGSWLDAAAEL